MGFIRMKNYKLSLIAARQFLQYCKDRRIYATLGRVQSWGSPDTISETNQESSYNLVNDFNDIVFAKEVLDTNYSLVVRRINWESKIFTQWSDSDPLIKDKDFYCLTSSNHVFKCLSNNKGVASTIEPNNVGSARFQTADGYIWKYLFSVTTDDALKFQTADWIPVKEIYTSEVGFENQYASQVAAVNGTVDRIDIIQSGSKYGPGTTVTITGDGSGATATLSIHPTTGAITSIDVVNNGNNYTWATVTINDPQVVPGTGAFANATLSPLYGHGFNPAEELFVSNVIVKCTVDGSEGGYIKGDISFRKVSLIVDPKLLNDTFATDFRYDNTVSVNVTSESGTFTVGERVNFTNGFGFVAYVGTGVLYLTSVIGSPSGVITGVSSAASATITSFTPKKFKVSGLTIFKSYFNPRTKLQGDNAELRPLFSF